MAPLREALTTAGFTHATTYINSGNALVRSTLSREKTIAQVAKLCKEHFGFDKAIFAPTATKWKAVIDNNPFPEVTEGKHLHAALLSSTPKPEAVEAIRALAVPGERLAIVRDVAYLHTPHGFGTSKFAAKFDKGIGVVNTARNWNTVLKMMELARRLEVSEFRNFETMADWHQHIASDPEVMYGKPCIKGTRIPVDLILDKLAAGQPVEDLLEGYPQLTRESIQACLRYGADAVRNDIELPYAS